MFRQLVRDNAILLVQYAVGALIPLLLIPYIVRFIGLNEYGHIAVAISWASYGAVVVQFSFQLTGPRRIAQMAANESDAGVFGGILVAKILLLVGVLPIMATLAVNLSSNSAAVMAIWMIMLGLPVAAALDATWFLQARGRFFSSSIVACIASIGTLLIGYELVSGTDAESVFGAAAAMTTGPLLAGIGTLSLALKLIGHREFRGCKIYPHRDLKEGWPLFSSQFVATIYSLAGPIVIAQIVGVGEAGAYSVVERMIRAVASACLLTHTAAYPRLAAAYIKDRALYWKIFQFVLATYLSVAAIVSIFGWTLRDVLVEYMTGANNLPGFDSLLGWGLAWFVLAVFGTALTGYLTVSGRSRDVLLLTLKIMVASLSLGVPGVLIFGGAGWMAALVLAQSLVLWTGYRIWRQDREG